jgi:hypothetical protein
MSEVVPSAQSRLEDTKNQSRLEETKKRLGSRNWWFLLECSGVLASLVSAALLFLKAWLDWSTMEPLWLCIYGAGILFSVGAALWCFTVAAQNRVEKNSLHEKQEDLEFQIDLGDDSVGPAERRAEKTLWRNDRRLQRYYDVNLKQNVGLFSIGIFCMVAGVIIAITTGAIAVSQEKIESKVIIAVLGAVSSVLTNYVAAIYLKMHASAAANLGRFHSRLVDTHQVLFGDLIASRIETKKTREQTLSKMAVNLTTIHGSEVKGDGASKSESEASGTVKGSRKGEEAGRAEKDDKSDEEQEEDSQTPPDRQSE